MGPQAKQNNPCEGIRIAFEHGQQPGRGESGRSEVFLGADAEERHCEEGDRSSTERAVLTQELS